MAKSKNTGSTLPPGLKELPEDPAPVAPATEAASGQTEPAAEPAAVPPDEIPTDLLGLDAAEVEVTARMLYVAMLNSHQAVNRDTTHLAEKAFEWAEIFHRAALARK
jgi:hypothetical protein